MKHKIEIQASCTSVQITILDDAKFINGNDEPYIVWHMKPNMTRHHVLTQYSNKVFHTRFYPKIKLFDRDADPDLSATLLIESDSDRVSFAVSQLVDREMEPGRIKGSIRIVVPGIEEVVSSNPDAVEQHTLLLKR